MIHCPRIRMAVVLLLAVGAPAFAQTTVNPNISVIPRFLLSTDDGSRLPAKREFSRPDFTLDELEVAFQAYLNPYARADVFISKSGLDDSPIEVEEAYASVLRGLPLDLNLRLGKYRTEFGKLNTLHPHAWPFISTPLSFERFLGEEGINDVGFSVSFLVPAGDDIYSRVSVDLLRGASVTAIDPISGGLNGGPGLQDTTGAGPYYANAARWMAFMSLSDYSDLEVGLSGLTGIHDPYHRLRFYYGNLDFKYKWKPDEYRTLVLQGEGLLNHRRVAHLQGGSGAASLKSVNSYGAYVFGDYTFHKVYSVGARYDWTESPYSPSDRAHAAAVFIGYYPVEETMVVRLELRRTWYDPVEAPSTFVNSIGLEFMFSMGPHKAHPF